MKIKKIYIISLLIILALMVTSVSAADMNDTISDGSNLESTQDDSVIELNETGNEFVVDAKDEYLIHYVRIDIKIPENAKNNLTMDIDNVNYKNISPEEISKYDGYFIFDLSNFSLGMHNLTFKYKDENYTFNKSIAVNLNLFEAYIPSPILINDETDDMGPHITWFGGYDLKGNVTIYIDGKKKCTYRYYPEDIEGYYVGNLAWGKHTIRVTFTNGSYYYSKEKNVTVDYNFPTYAYLVYGKKHSITINLPQNLGKSKLTVTIDGKKCKYVRSKGQLKITDINLSMGHHKVTITYAGDKKYPSKVETHDIKVTGEIQYPDTNVYATSTDEISLMLPKDAKGKLLVKINIFRGSEFVPYDQIEVPFVDGKAIFSFKGLPINEYYDFNCRYTGADYEVDSYGGCAHRIIEPKLSGAKDIKMTYSDGTTFKVKVKDSLGNILEGVYVTIKIDGKKVKRVMTNEYGIATYKITQSPKKYKITAQLGNAKVTKSLTVKQVLSIKKVTVKKNARKLVLTATLKKIKGKYQKGKKITFKFNGKTYKTKTNKKGIAKVTIKKSVLKKLKKGKKIEYQATYIKDTVKRTAKVK